MKLGIFGAAFDPITNGHLWTVETALRFAKLDRVIFVPSSDCRMDKGRKLTNDEHRLNMINITIKKLHQFEVSTIEIINPKEYQYTYHTMEYFKQKYSQDDMYFIMGADVLKELPYWSKGNELIKNNKFIVIPRNNINMQQVISNNLFLNNYKDKFILIEENIEMPISSSCIRNQIQQGENPKDLLPKGCYNYILKNGLYQHKT